MPYPRLGHRAIDAYNRLAKECAAYNYVLRHTKQTGPVSWQTLMALNGMIILANRLFRRHADLPRFLPVDTTNPMSQADFAVLVTRLLAACIHFEEHYTASSTRDIARHYIAVEKSSYKR